MDMDSTEHVNVDMYHTGISRGSISTDALGPCIGFVLDFNYLGSSMCLLQHYSFNFDETDSSPSDFLETLLNMLFDELKSQIHVQTIIPDSSGNNGINVVRLLVAGGDISEAALTKTSISLLNINNNNIKNELFRNEDVHYLYNQLRHRAIIFESATKNLSHKEKEKG